MESRFLHLDTHDTYMPKAFFLGISDLIINIKSIREDKKYNNLSIAVYNADSTVSDEEYFVAGANIICYTIMKSPR